MSAKGPNHGNRTEARSMMMRLPAKIWEALEHEASTNYRALNAEIAVRVLESLPRE